MYHLYHFRWDNYRGCFSRKDFRDYPLLKNTLKCLLNKISLHIFAKPTPLISGGVAAISGDFTDEELEKMIERLKAKLI